MDHNPEEFSSLRREFIEAAVKYEDAGYKTFIQRTAHSEEGYYETGRNDCVAEIKWPYRPWRKCWILAPSSGTNEEPFAVMKTLFTKAWLSLPRVVAGRIVDAAECQLSPRVDVGLLWANSHYEFWCWLLWFDWLWGCGEIETEEPEFQPAGMDLRPFSSSVELIARWGLDGSAGDFPVWLSTPPNTKELPLPAAAGGRTVQQEEHENRKLVAERWDEFCGGYKSFGYKRRSWEHFANWATDKFDDMPSDDPVELKRMVDAYRKTPSPRMSD